MLLCNLEVYARVTTITQSSASYSKIPYVTATGRRRFKYFLDACLFRLGELLPRHPASIILQLVEFIKAYLNKGMIAS